jgi:hypothetical protein
MIEKSTHVELQNLYCFCNTVRAIRSGEDGMEQVRNAYKILVGKSQGAGVGGSVVP